MQDFGLKLDAYLHFTVLAPFLGFPPHFLHSMRNLAEKIFSSLEKIRVFVYFSFSADVLKMFKVIHVELANERGNLAMVEVLRDYFSLEGINVFDIHSTAILAPGDDGVAFLVFDYLEELDEEVVYFGKALLNHLENLKLLLTST